jgi:hypothetical protein
VCQQPRTWWFWHWSINHSKETLIANKIILALLSHQHSHYYQHHQHNPHQ